MARKALFHPSDAPGGPDLTTLLWDRLTHMAPVQGVQVTKIADYWGGFRANPTAVFDSPTEWVGLTMFYKDPTRKTTPSVYGLDTWAETSTTWVRTHVNPRTEPFYPYGWADGPKEGDLADVRVTEMLVGTAQQKVTFKDYFENPDPEEWSVLWSWVGKTSFL